MRSISPIYELRDERFAALFGARRGNGKSRIESPPRELILGPYRFELLGPGEAGNTSTTQAVVRWWDCVADGESVVKVGGYGWWCATVNAALGEKDAFSRGAYTISGRPLAQLRDWLAGFEDEYGERDRQ